MYLDDLPDLSRARSIRARSRGVAIRDGDRAVAVAFVSDGSQLPADTIVRFDVTRGEDPARRLADALGTTGARNVWFYGGDIVTRTAVIGLDLATRPTGAVFVRRMDAPGVAAVTLRAPTQRDRITVEEQQREHASWFEGPQVEIAENERDAIGVVFAQALDDAWSEIRAVVSAGVRGHGYGGALFAAAADRIEATGRRVCAAVDSIAGRERRALERAGFRLADYYFTAARR